MVDVRRFWECDAKDLLDLAEIRTEVVWWVTPVIWGSRTKGVFDTERFNILAGHSDVALGVSIQDLTIDSIGSSSLRRYGHQTDSTVDPPSWDSQVTRGSGDWGILRLAI